MQIVFVFPFVTIILLLYWPSSFILFISMALFFFMCIGFDNGVC